MFCMYVICSPSLSLLLVCAHYVSRFLHTLSFQLSLYLYLSFSIRFTALFLDSFFYLRETIVGTYLYEEFNLKNNAIVVSKTNQNMIWFVIRRGRSRISSTCRRVSTATECGCWRPESQDQLQARAGS